MSFKHNSLISMLKLADTLNMASYDDLLIDPAKGLHPKNFQVQCCHMSCCVTCKTRVWVPKVRCPYGECYDCDPKGWVQDMKAQLKVKEII